MNADDFRDYMLSFLFLRYLSGNYEAAAKKELGVDYPKLENGVMSRIAIPFPSLAEQQRIAACRSSLDDPIAVESEKLDTLKTHKKALTQQLFPAQESV